MIAHRLGAFASGLQLGDIPPDVLDKARACLAHALTIGAAGRVTPLGAYAEAAIGDASGPSRLLTSGRRVPAQQAAMVNSALFHARAQEDTHGTAHLGSVLIPAAFAVAEEVDADGATLLCAVVAGYEVGARLARQYTALSSARGFRASAVYGPLAAAAAAGRVLGLGPEQLGTGLSFASAFAGGTLQSFAEGTTEWQFQNGVGAQSGIYGARLAAAGAAGAPHAIEGPSGFLAAVAGTTEGAEDIGSDLGETWETRNVTFKLFPVCAFNQTPVTLAARLTERHGLRPADVVHARMEMNPYEAGYPGMGSAGPFATPGQTLMSTRFTIASAIARGTVTYADLTRYDDPEVAALVARIDVEADPSRPPMTGRLVVETAGGQVHEDVIEAPADDLAWGFARSREIAERVAPETGMSGEDLDELIARIATLEDGPAARVLDPVLAGLGSERSVA